MKNPLLLVDGSSYFFRAFHALPPLVNSKGQPTGAIYGVANMIKRLAKDYQSEHIAVVFDAKGKTFRDEWYPEYKAHRPPMPTELSSQFHPLLEVLGAMGIPLIIKEGVEADDVLGTLAREATEVGLPVVISTGDKDMAQLVNEHVTLVNTMSNQVLDVDGVKEKFGVTPAQIIDYLALIGDVSDNVPGIHKCGPKTAVKWLSHYHTLDNLVADAQQISGKIGEYLRAGLSQLALSKRLVTIKTDVELPISFKELKREPANREKLIELYREYEFKTWLKDLLAEQEEPAPTPAAPVLTNTPMPYEIITSLTQLEHWVNQLKASPLFCIDTETTHIDAMRAELVGISLAIEPNAPAYIPMMHNDHSPQLSRFQVLAALKPILEDKTIKKVGQNLKYDAIVLKNHGITLQGITFDTMLESYLLNSTRTRHNMDALALT